MADESKPKIMTYSNDEIITEEVQQSHSDSIENEDEVSAQPTEPEQEDHSQIGGAEQIQIAGEVAALAAGENSEVPPGDISTSVTGENSGESSEDINSSKEMSEGMEAPQDVKIPDDESGVGVPFDTMRNYRECKVTHDTYVYLETPKEKHRITTDTIVYAKAPFPKEDLKNGYVRVLLIDASYGWIPKADLEKVK